MVNASTTTATTFAPPHKQLILPSHLEAFQNSTTHAQLLAFIEALNEAVIDHKLSSPCQISPPVEAVLALLDRIQASAESIPPVDNKLSRFGNPAFRTFYDVVAEALPDLHSTIPGLASEAIPEISTYLVESWGNRTRIDYGSGMELNFICWLLCLRKLGVFTDVDNKALVLKVFWKYITIMRYLQKTYWLEPAGSHGVWGLDDYHFLPFLFGSGQLKDHKHLRPKSIHDPDILDQFGDDYMYFACIRFINSIKTASLRWHSPMLDDISAVKTWSKVNGGMLKMFKAEVLGRLPVMQHFLFGSLLPVPPGLEDLDGEDVVSHGDHVHAKKTVGDVKGKMFGDCCGIPVPSAFAAGLQERDPKAAQLGAITSGRPRLLPVD